VQPFPFNAVRKRVRGHQYTSERKRLGGHKRCGPKTRALLSALTHADLTLKDTREGCWGPQLTRPGENGPHYVTGEEKESLAIHRTVGSNTHQRNRRRGGRKAPPRQVKKMRHGDGKKLPGKPHTHRSPLRHNTQAEKEKEGVVERRTQRKGRGLGPLGGFWTSSIHNRRIEGLR
jgi:hypothetical protein